MSRTTKLLARSAIGAAVGVVLLYVASVLPSGRLGMLCISGFAVIFVLMSCGWRWALGAFACTALLGIFLLPDKAIAASYALFAGWYPVVKLALERSGSQARRWIGKFLIFNAVFIPGALVLRELFFAGTRLEAVPFLWILLAANVCFLIYDYACKYLILFYIRKIARRWK